METRSEHPRDISDGIDDSKPSKRRLNVRRGAVLMVGALLAAACGGSSAAADQRGTPKTTIDVISSWTDLPTPDGSGAKVEVVTIDGYCAIVTESPQANADDPIVNLTQVVDQQGAALLANTGCPPEHN